MSKHRNCDRCSRPMKYVSTTHGNPKNVTLCSDRFECKPCRIVTHVALECTAKCNEAKQRR